MILKFRHWLAGLNIVNPPVAIRIGWFFILGFLAVPFGAFSEPSIDPLWDEVRTAIRQVDYSTALTLLDQIPNSETPKENVRKTYLKGSLLFKSSQPEEALQEFNSLEGRYPEMEDYRLLNLAKLQIQLGKFDRSEKIARKLRTQFPDSRLIPHSLFVESEGSLQGGNFGNCIKTGNRFLSGYPSDEQKPQVLFLIAQCREGLSQWVKAYEGYQAVFYGHADSEFAEPARQKTVALRKNHDLPFPAPTYEMRMKRVKGLLKARQASWALDLLLQMQKLPFTSLQQQAIQETMVECHKTLGNHRIAADLLEHLLKTFPNTVKRVHWLSLLSRIYWNLGKDNETLKLNNEILNKHPGHPLGGKAMYINARVSESRGYPERARKYYLKLVNRFPESKLSEESRWRVGWTYFLSGNPKETGNYYRRMIRERPQSVYADNFMFWLADSKIVLEHREKGRQILQQLADRFPLTYYGQRARVRLLDAGPLRSLREANYPTGIDHRGSVSDPGFFMGEEPSKRDIPWNLTNRLVRMEELIFMGFGLDAELEIKPIAARLEKTDPNVTWLAYKYAKAGLYHMAIRTVDGSHPWRGGSDMQRKLLYPLGYWDGVREYSKQNGLDPLLVLAIIRRESVFDPKVVSISRAIGLMQLLSSTGKRMYRQLHQEEFQEKVLFDPEINVEVGTRYLAKLLSLNNNNLFWTLVSYNAGYQRAKRWKNEFGDLPLEAMVERISFPESKEYVK